MVESIIIFFKSVMFERKW